jgi:hypothetical protein
LIDFVFDGLSFLKLVESVVLHNGMVKEDIPSLAGNKAESPVRDHLLDRTLRHGSHSLRYACCESDMTAGQK